MLLYGVRKNATVAGFRARQEVSLAAVDDGIQTDLNGVEADLRFATSLASLKELLHGDFARGRERLTSDLIELCRHKKNIDRARMLDAKGREVVRVELGPDGPVAAATGGLSDLSRRYWVAEAFRLPAGQTYVSPIELAMENGTVAIPYKVIVRFATPVADRTGVVRGLVALNVLAEPTLDRVRAGAGAPAPLMLLNADGFWLVGPNPGSEWGFAVPGRKERAYSREEPAVWERISGAKAGVFEDPSGLIAFRTIEAPAGAVSSPLKLVSLVPRTVAEIPLREVRQQIAFGAAGILVLLGIAAGVQSSASERVRRAGIEALRQEQRFRTLFERNLAGVYRSTVDGRLLDCNDAFVRILGFENREEALACPTTSHYADPLDRSRLIENLREKGLVQSQELRLRRKDGRETWAFLNIGFVPGPNGEASVLEGTLLDISERKRAEEAILHQKAVLETVMTNMAQAMLIVDSELRIVAFNSKFEPLFGFAEGEMRVGESVETPIRLWATRTGIDAAQLEKVLRALRKKEPFVSDYRQQVLGGTTTWIQLFHNPLPEGGFVRTYADITERKRAEEALVSSERFSRAIVENMLGGLVIADEAGLIKSVNPAAERVFNWTNKELVGRPLTDLLPSEAEKESPTFHWSVYEKAIGRVTEWEGRRKNGEAFPLELSLFEFETPEGRHFGGNVRDITERREVERLKKEFVSTVSHELRTPLTSIRGSLGLLRSGAVGELPAEAGDLVAMAERNVIRLIGLINDILDLERLEDGRIELHMAPVPADDAVSRAMEAVHAFAEQQGILLVSRPSGAVVRADSDRLVQVLVNLLSNAVKFSPRGSTVSVSVTDQSDMATFRVADRGRGIPPALRAAIFERYRQVEAGDARVKGGTGLGLAICKAIVEQHGGTIGVESEEGQGSTFWFRVPLAVSPRISASSLTAQAPKLALLVDDDMELLTILARQLTEKGIGVQMAASVQEARDAVQAVRPDVLVLDLGLPDGDGQKVVDTLRSSPGFSRLPLLVYTGRDLTARDRANLVLGPTHHLTKSKASDEEVVRAISELIKAGRAGRTSGTIRKG